MKSIRVHQTGEPEVMKLEEIQTPQPDSGQILVRIHAAGVNPVDTYIRSGKYARKEPLPYTPGTDGAGVITAVGKNVSRFAPGDRVYTAGSLTGTYAEFALCTEAQVHRLPENVSFEQGAAINVPYATAYRALFFKARAIGGEWILIHGASGGVGIAATQIARAAGLKIIGTASSEKGQQLVKEQGAAHVLNHSSPDYLQKIMEITQGRGVDIIIEMLSNVNLGKDLTVLAREGRVVVVGSRGTVEINPRDAMSRDASILGMTLFNASEKELFSIHSALVSGLEVGTLRPVIGQRIPLGEAPRSHHAVLEAGAYGKIVLVP